MGGKIREIRMKKRESIQKRGTKKIRATEKRHLANKKVEWEPYNN